MSASNIRSVSVFLESSSTDSKTRIAVDKYNKTHNSRLNLGSVHCLGLCVLLLLSTVILVFLSVDKDWLKCLLVSVVLFLFVKLLSHICQAP